MNRLIPPTVLILWGMLMVAAAPMGPDLDNIPGTLADARTNNCFLEYGWQWVSGQRHSVWDAPFFYPERRAMAYSDNHLGTLPAYALFRFAGLDRETAFQAWIAAMFLLNFAACRWVLWRIGRSPLGAAAGAFVFTFSMPVAAGFDHPQMLPRFAVPMAVYFLWQWLRSGRLKFFGLTCLFAVWQWYCGIYTGYFLSLLAAAFAFLYAAGRLVRMRKRIIFRPGAVNALLHLAVALIACAALAVLLWPYYEVSREWGMISWEGLSSYLPRVKSYLLPPAGSPWHGLTAGLAAGIPEVAEHRLFPGILPLASLAAVILAGAWKLTGRRTFAGGFTLICAGAAALLIAVTLYAGGDSMYRIFYGLPGVGAVRAVARIITILLFPLAACVAAAADAVVAPADSRFDGKGYPPAALAIAVIVTIAVAADQYVPPSAVPAYSKSASVLRSARIAHAVEGAAVEPQVFAYVPENSGQHPNVVHVDAMMASQDCGVPTINGYSGSLPPGYIYFYRDFYSVNALKLWVIIHGARTGRCGGLFDNLLVLEGDGLKARKLVVGCPGGTGE